MQSVPLLEAVERLKAVFTSDSLLIPTLAEDALVARAKSGELKACLPRLLELAGQGQLVDVRPFEVFRLLGEWQRWPHAERNALLNWADAWWLTALAEDPRIQTNVKAADVLGELTHLGEPMIRWLNVWRDHLDGSGAVHLVGAILDGEETDAWTESGDERGQLVAWASGETIVMGLVTVGALHLPSDRLSLALDSLLDPDSVSV